MTMARFDAYWSAVERGDEGAALDIARQQREDGASVEQVLDDLVIRSQRRVGRRWADNEWTVAREHGATAVGEHVVDRLAATLPQPEGPAYLVGCVEREWHALPGMVLSTILRSRGYRTLWLGASLAREQLLTRILDTGPRAVLLSASLSSSLPRVRSAIETVRGTSTPVVVGGSAFDEHGAWAGALGATGHGTSIEQTVEVLDTLPRHVGEPRSLRHPGADEARAIVASAAALTQCSIEELFARLEAGDGEAAGLDGWTSILVGHVHHVVDALAGSLMVEDPLVLHRQREWLDEVLIRRGAPSDTTKVLWQVLAEQLREHPEAASMLQA